MNMRSFALRTVPLFLLAACQSTRDADHASAGRMLFQNNCAACHGQAGRGDGPLAAQLGRKPADLSRLSEEWTVYPSAHVMGYIDGYTREGAEGEIMPTFGGEMLEAETILYDSGDGILTPTPLPLVQLAEYIETLQVEVE